MIEVKTMFCSLLSLLLVSSGPLSAFVSVFDNMYLGGGRRDDRSITEKFICWVKLCRI